MSFQTIQPIKAWKVRIQILSDLRQSNKLRTEILHLQRQRSKPTITLKLGPIVVLKLSHSYKNKGRTITCDNFFTIPKLGRNLLQRKLTKSETTRKNLTEFPTTFIVAKRRKVFSKICGFQRDKTFVSFHPNKNKVALLLSDTGIESSGENKHEK